MMLIKHKENSIKQSITISILISTLGVLLNQSNVMFGINISFADLVIVGLVSFLLINNMFEIPFTSLVVFFSFLSILLINTVFIIPNVYGVILIERSVVTDFIKLIVIFLYFVIGYQLSKLNLIESLLKAFSIAAILIGLVGIMFTFIEISFLSEIMFFGGIRLRGLMNDPNYFSVIQVTALAVLVRQKYFNENLRYISILIIIFSLISSGSKTGMITLFFYYCYWLFNTFIEGKLKIRTLTKVISILLLFISILPYLIKLTTNLFSIITNYFPIFQRVELLITNFDEAVNSGGSSRNVIWETGLEIIKSSPLFGVGIGGNYISISQTISGVSNVAHNTYIQMAAEWGLPVTIILIIYIYSLFFKANKTTGQIQIIYTIREMLFAFLVSSLAISFNNSRLFWLLIGAATFYIVQKKDCMGKN